MDDQNEAWRRLTDARLRYLEAAVQPGRIRRTSTGKPLPPLPYEPGEKVPLTRWLIVRQEALELIVRLLLDADEQRGGDDTLEASISADLEKLADWASSQVEPDLASRESMAAVLAAQTILMESPAWPLEA